MEREYSELALYLRTQLKEKDLPNEAEIGTFIKKARKFFSARDVKSEDLIATKQILQLSGQPTSPPSVCANYLIFSFGNQLNDEAIRQMQSGNRKKFSMLYDYANGVITPMETILWAESYISGGAHDPKNLSAAANALRMDIIEETETFLAVNNVQSSAAQLLKQDPTGFKLLEAPLLQAENNLIISPQDKIVLAGARHAVDIYKNIYPLSQNLD